MSMDLTNVQAYQDYVSHFEDKLYNQLFGDFETAKLITPHEGVKGKMPLTEITLGALSKRWRSQWDGNADALDFIPRTLEVEHVKAELAVVPQRLETSYLGRMRQKGQNPEDFPFQEQVLGLFTGKIKDEEEDAAWLGVKTGSPAALDPLLSMVDGFREICQDEITATNLTPVATGALTESNAYTHIKTMFQRLGAKYQRVPMDVWLSPNALFKVTEQFRNDVGKYTTNKDGSVNLPLGRLTFHPVIGLGSSDFVMMTPRENLHYGYDGPDDEIIRFQTDIREVKMWSDFKIGFQIAIIHDDILVVNDQ